MSKFILKNKALLKGVNFKFIPWASIDQYIAPPQLQVP